MSVANTDVAEERAHVHARQIRSLTVAAHARIRVGRLVMPAHAGIQFRAVIECCLLDSCFRRSDGAPAPKGQ